MLNRTFRLAVCVTVGAVMSGSALTGCTEKRHKDRFRWSEFVGNAVARKATHGNASVFFDVRRIMPFGWEKFYVFPPHSTTETIESALGFDWPEAEKTGIGERDDITLLVFVTGRTVQEHIEQPRTEGDFSQLKAAYPYTPQEAYFELTEEDRGGQRWYVFVDADRSGG